MMTTATARSCTWLALVLALGACDDPTALLDPPPPPNELTLHAVLDPDEARQHFVIEPVSVSDAFQDINVRLYENGQLVATAHIDAFDPQDPRLQGCAAAFGGVLALKAGVCVAVDWWPRYGNTYRVEADAAGYRTAVGETRIPEYFSVVEAGVRGSPAAGVAAVSLDWTPGVGVHTYVVSVRSEGANCSGPGCDTGWYAETDSTTFTSDVPEDHFGDASEPYVVEVIGLTQSLYEYLTTGASGDLFAVPPVQNVEGGSGVVGAWVRRPVRFVEELNTWLPDPVIFRGDWNVVPSPDDFFLQDLSVRPGDPGEILVRGALGVYHSSNPGGGWSTVFGPEAIRVFDTDAGAFMTTADTLYRFVPETDEWTSVGVVPGQVVAIHVSAVDGVMLLRAANFPDRLLRSADGGTTFDTVDLPVLDTDEPYWVRDLAEDPGDGTLYAAITRSTYTSPTGPPLLRSHDRGRTWEAGGKLPWDATQVAAGQDRVYAIVESTERGLYVSDDHGDTWTRTVDRQLSTVVVEPGGNRVWVGGPLAINPSLNAPGGVMISRDSGTTFEGFALQGVDVKALALNPTEGSIYALTRELDMVRHVIPRAPPRPGPTAAGGD